jgi:hypothetical protein
MSRYSLKVVGNIERKRPVVGENPEILLFKIFKLFTGTVHRSSNQIAELSLVFPPQCLVRCGGGRRPVNGLRQ